AGLTVLAAFTIEKNLVNADYPLSGGNSLFGLSAPQDNANYKALKAYSPNDIPKRFVVSYVYELPFGTGKRFSLKGPMNFLLGNWRISGIYGYQNNTPLAFTTSLANPLFGGPVRPNVGNGVPFRAPISGSSFNPFKDNYISPGFMTLPAAFTLGSAALNYNFRGCAARLKVPVRKARKPGAGNIPASNPDATANFRKLAAVSAGREDSASGCEDDTAHIRRGTPAPDPPLPRRCAARSRPGR